MANQPKKGEEPGQGDGQSGAQSGNPLGGGRDKREPVRQPDSSQPGNQGNAANEERGGKADAAEGAADRNRGAQSD